MPTDLMNPGQNYFIAIVPTDDAGLQSTTYSVLGLNY